MSNAGDQQQHGLHGPDGVPGRVVVVTGLSRRGQVDGAPAPRRTSASSASTTCPRRSEPAVEALRVGRDHPDRARHRRPGGLLPGGRRRRRSTRSGRRRDVVILFLDASDEALLRRFSETRRPHPLTTGGSGAIAMLDGVLLERERLASLRARATIELDTTRLSTHDLRRRRHRAARALRRSRCPGCPPAFVSFGYKYGIPLDADLLFDVRFLDNPYFVHGPPRRSRGPTSAVREYILKNPDALEFICRTEQLLSFCMPRYASRRKELPHRRHRVHGGRHRSVVLTNALADSLRRRDGAPHHGRAPGRRPGEREWCASGVGEGHGRGARRGSPAGAAGTTPSEPRPASDTSVTGASGDDRGGNEAIHHHQCARAPRARATKLVQLAGRYDCEISLDRAGRAVGQREERDGRAAALRLDGHPDRGERDGRSGRRRRLRHRRADRRALRRARVTRSPSALFVGRPGRASRPGGCRPERLGGARPPG